MQLHPGGDGAMVITFCGLLFAGEMTPTGKLCLEL